MGVRGGDSRRTDDGHRRGTPRAPVTSIGSATASSMALLVGALTSGLLVGTPATGCCSSAVQMGLHDVKAKTMAGAELDLGTLKGKKVLALNVASK